MGSAISKWNVDGAGGTVSEETVLKPGDLVKFNTYSGYGSGVAILLCIDEWTRSRGAGILHWRLLRSDCSDTRAVTEVFLEKVC
jgi:hypothetical protein